MTYRQDPHGSFGAMRGLQSVVIGLRLISQPGLRGFVVVPFLINLAVFVLLGWLLLSGFQHWLDNLSWLQDWREQWFVGAVITLIEWLLAAAFFFIFLLTFTLIANLIGAPFNSLLSARIEQRLTGRLPVQHDGSALELMRSIPRTLWTELRKLLYILWWFVPIGVLYLIPGVQLLAPAITLLFGAWVVALEYLDYPMGNHGHRFVDVRLLARQRRAAALGLGGGLSLLMLIPLLNFIAMPVGVAAATVLWLERPHDD